MLADVGSLSGDDRQEGIDTALVATEDRSVTDDGRTDTDAGPVAPEDHPGATDLGLADVGADIPFDLAAPADVGGCPCPARYVCRTGTCVPLPAACCVADGDCDDHDARTHDRCDAPTGRCVHMAMQCDAALACDDGIVCTADHCAPGGTCSYDPIAGCCDAAHPCTLQGYLCNGATHACEPGRACTLSFECTGSTFCSQQICAAGACVDLHPIPDCGCMGSLVYLGGGAVGCYSCGSSGSRQECCGDSDCDDHDPTTWDECTPRAWRCRHTIRPACVVP